MQIAIVGTGYVGLIAGVCFAEVGHSITCVDSDLAKISLLQKRKPTFFEPGLEDALKNCGPNLKFVESIDQAVKGAEVLFIAVGTPELHSGEADMSFTFKVLKEVCAAVTSPLFLVLKSTVPVGTAREVKEYCLKHSRTNISVINNPEFLKQGAALSDFRKPDRVVIGCADSQSREIMTKLYQPFVNGTNQILFMDNISAEMTKYAANSFLALKISFINELALLCDKMGGDINLVRAGFTSDHRINPAFFNPGIGYGGSCFPKDVRALSTTAEESGFDFKLLKTLDQVNERQKRILTDRIISRFGSLKDVKIAVWGLSFKPNTDDVRRAPSLQLIADMRNLGANVVAYDPVAASNAKKFAQVDFELAASPLEATKNADVLVVVTEWAEFEKIPLKKIAESLGRKIIFDGRNIFNLAELQRYDFEYYGIGRSLNSLFEATKTIHQNYESHQD